MLQKLFYLLTLSIGFVTTSLYGATIAHPGEHVSIQAAIDAASNGDTINVAAGTYNENINFGGKDITVQCTVMTDTDELPDNNNDGIPEGGCILDGGGNGSVVSFDDGETSAASLSGFTITGGTGSECPWGYDLCGGGIFINNNSNPTLTGLTVFGNTAIEHGGGIYIHNNSDPTLTNLTVSGNEARYGGGIYIRENSNPTLTDLTVTGNTAHDRGGGIYIRNSNPTLTNLTVTGNTADDGGGILISVNSDPTLTNLTVSSNHAFNGGGIYIRESSNPTLTNLTVTGNTATYYGGGIHIHNNSDPTLTNSILWQNNAIIGKEIYVSSNSEITVSHSIVEDGEDGIESTGTVNWDASNKEDDPKFLDAASGDYSLKAENCPSGELCSPAIDAGTSSFIVNLKQYTNETDCTNNGGGWTDSNCSKTITIDQLDYFGSAPDMGAHEYIDSCSDTDGDGVCNGDDLCEGFNDHYDFDNNGIADCTESGGGSSSLSSCDISTFVGYDPNTDPDPDDCSIDDFSLDLLYNQYKDQKDLKENCETLKDIQEDLKENCEILKENCEMYNGIFINHTIPKMCLKAGGTWDSPNSSYQYYPYSSDEAYAQCTVADITTDNQASYDLGVDSVNVEAVCTAAGGTWANIGCTASTTIKIDLDSDGRDDDDYSEGRKSGDINEDGNLNILDILKTIDKILHPAN